MTLKIDVLFWSTLAVTLAAKSPSDLDLLPNKKYNEMMHNFLQGSAIPSFSLRAADILALTSPNHSADTKSRCHSSWNARYVLTTN